MAALAPAITAANGQSTPLQQAQLVLSGSVMSIVAVGPPSHQISGSARGEQQEYQTHATRQNAQRRAKDWRMQATLPIALNVLI